MDKIKSDINQRVKIIDDLEKNLLVSASAGSGKTTILVERMVAIIENSKDPIDISKMAALTFTKKAAAEFYDRFYKKLQLRIKDGFDVKRDDEYSLLKNPNQEQVRRDKEALKNIDSCFFGTIDSYYQKILNEHPLEAGLSSSATIIDDEEFNLYLIKKFSNYFKSENPEIRKGATFFAKYVGAKHFPNMMVYVLDNYEHKLFNIDKDPNDIIEDFKKYFAVFKRGLIFLHENKGTFFATKTEKDGSVSAATVASGKAWKYLDDKIGAIRNLKEDDYKSAKEIIKNIVNLRYIYNPEIADLDYKEISINDVYTEEKSKNKLLFKEINDNLYKMIEGYIYSKVIIFLELVKDDIRKSLVNDGLLTFHEATFHLLEMLRKEKENKDVILEIRKNVEHLLIDECQDTDIRQYEIFFRLTANDFNSDFKKLDIDGGKLYCCGDRKQGIYHFRGADVKTFDEIKEIFEKNKNEGKAYDIVVLTDNYRSKGALIQYFNNTFELMLENQGYDPVLNDDIKSGEENYTSYYYESTQLDDPKHVSNIILKMVQDNNYSFKDFMVITSSKAKILNYSKEFSKRGIPCYCEGYIDINISSLVKGVISIFKYIASNKEDNIALLETLTSPIFNYEVKDTINLKHNFLNDINLEDKKFIWPSDLLEYIASNSNVIKRLNLKGLDVLIGFISLLKEEENSGNINSFDDAIKYFTKFQDGDEIKERLSLLSNSINAVQIANVHKTKGLEKKIVILTFASTKKKVPALALDDKYLYLLLLKENDYPYFSYPFKDNLTVEGIKEKEIAYSIEEDERLLYVAGTRAKDYLFICKSLNKKGTASTSKWDALIEPFSLKLIADIETDRNVEIKSDSGTDYKNPLDSFDKNKKSYKIVKPSKERSKTIYDEGYSLSIDSEDSLVIGTIIHKLMEYIIKSKDKVLGDKICEYIATNYNRKDLLSLLIDVKETIYNGGYYQESNPYKNILKFAQENKTYTEVPFSYYEDKTLINGVMDLVVETEKEIIVFDYKTDIFEVDHSKQLNLYESAIKKCLNNNKPVKSFIYRIYK